MMERTKLIVEGAYVRGKNGWVRKVMNVGNQVRYADQFGVGTLSNLSMANWLGKDQSPATTEEIVQIEDAINRWESEHGAAVQSFLGIVLGGRPPEGHDSSATLAGLGSILLRYGPMMNKEEIDALNAAMTHFRKGSDTPS